KRPRRDAARGPLHAENGLRLVRRERGERARGRDRGRVRGSPRDRPRPRDEQQRSLTAVRDLRDRGRRDRSEGRARGGRRRRARRRAALRDRERRLHGGAQRREPRDDGRPLLPGHSTRLPANSLERIPYTHVLAAIPARSRVRGSSPYESTAPRPAHGLAWARTVLGRVLHVKKPRTRLRIGRERAMTVAGRGDEILYGDDPRRRHREAIGRL